MVLRNTVYGFKTSYTQVGAKYCPQLINTALLGLMDSTVSVGYYSAVHVFAIIFITILNPVYIMFPCLQNNILHCHMKVIRQTSIDVMMRQVP